MQRISKVFTLMSALLALAFCLASCKSNVDDNPTMYTVTVSDSIEHGTVTADKSSAEAGATIKLTATADSGYELDSYSVKDASANELTVTDGTFTMPESNVTVTATFTALPPDTVFRASTAEVVAGDITVSSDGGNTLKFVPAENWDAELYTGYTALGVCVNTSYMINLVNENMSWNTATSTYPNDNWRMPTNAELKAICNVKGTLNTSLATISGAEQLIDSYYLSSETYGDEFACVVDFSDGKVKYYYKTDSKLVRVVRALN